MHELGIVMNIIRTAERLAAENSVSRLGSVTVEIGELSGVIPKYVNSFWKEATVGTACEGSELIIKEVTGMVRCLSCGKEYRILENAVNEKPVCPYCQYEHWVVLTGREILITEIGAYDE